MKKIILLLTILILSVCQQVYAQKFLMDMVDTTSDIGKGIFSLYKNFGTLRFSGYMQPQFQVAEFKGTQSYNGGNFAPNSDNRFMFRRARIRLDYSYLTENHDPSTYFVFQIDATERGVVARDVWGRFFENKWKIAYLTTGLFARPFGWEVNYSSSVRETPERGRMSQILMKTERDLGAMITLESRKKDAKLNKLKFDIGVFNGQGLAGPGEFDSYKDLISRLYWKQTRINAGGLLVSGGISLLYGAIGSQSPVVYNYMGSGDNYRVVKDSAQSNIDKGLPRRYYGADAQIKIPNKKGFTEFRAELIVGKQTATATTTETPGTYPVSAGAPQSLYTRSFNGTYFYFLQHLWSTQHQFLLKYDWYDPNSRVAGPEVTGSRGLTVADIKYSTLGIGYIYYFNAHLKLVLYYDWVRNESTNIKGYTADVPDNVFTTRLHYSF